MLRIGVVEYLLGLPLVYGLDGADESGVELTRDTPAGIAELITAGKLDVGLTPVAALLDTPGLRVVPGLCVACDGAVGSIRLFHRCPLGQVRRVALDHSSRTSAILARILLRELWHVEPECIAMLPDLPRMMGSCDAALLIGDPALAAVSLDPWVDLGEAWKELTGLPFVFAVWAAREVADAQALVRLLRGAYERGRAAIPEIARREAAARGMHVADAIRYLTHNIRYELDGRALEGLRRFVELAEAQGLVNNRGRGIQFIC